MKVIAFGLLVITNAFVITFCDDGGKNGQKSNISAELARNEPHILVDVDQVEEATSVINNTFRSSPDERLETFTLNVWYIFLAVLISMTFLFLLNFVLSKEMISCKMCTVCREREKETVPCYLCDQKVNKAQWNDSSHRKQCANKKKAVLDRMPRPLEVNCPSCKQVLRLWPQNLGEGFFCDNVECRSPRDELIYNSGYNRLNCFVCDFDICMACANRLVCIKQNVKPNVSNTGLAARNWMIHMNPLAKKSFESQSSSRSAKKLPNRGINQSTTAAVFAAMSFKNVARHSSIKSKRKSSKEYSHSSAVLAARRTQSVKAAPYARRPGYSASIKSCPPQAIVNREVEDDDYKSRIRSSSSRRPFIKATSLDATNEDKNSDKRPAVVKIEINTEDEDDEISDDMVSAASEIRRLRTLSEECN